MKYKIKTWQDLLKANNQPSEELLQHLDGFKEDESLIDAVKNNSTENNEELVRCICEMMEDSDPAIKSMTYEVLNSGEFEITEIRKDGR